MPETKDEIHERMMNTVDGSYDKTEGSFAYDFTRPAAIELETAYADQENILNKGFADTAVGTDLERLVYLRTGIIKKVALKATTIVRVTGAQGANINTGDLVASDTVNFVFKETKVIDGTGQADVLVECEVVGSIGNVPIGAIKYFPVTLAGLTSVTNPEAVTNGYDGETDPELLQRYLEHICTPATSGNKYHYKNWAKEVSGCGDAKVYPLWNGRGTVKVAIININKRAANAQLVTDVSSYIEEQRPIGAIVTVVSATEKVIDVSFTATKDPAYTDQQRLANVTAALNSYLDSIAYKENLVSYAKVGNAIIDSAGILDYEDLTINGGTANIVLSDTGALTEIAVLGVVTIA